MAYTKANFQLFEEFPIENTVKEFMYLNAAGDSIATMTAAGYISDAGTKRVAVGDLVHVITQSPATYNIMQVTALITTGTGANAAYANTATMAATGASAGNQMANFRNLIDGGDFSVNPWQRGTTPAAVTSTTCTYVADRWFVAGATTCSITVTDPAITAVPGFTNALQFTRTAAQTTTTALYLGQIVESLDVYRARGQFLTLSFWAAAGANYSPTTAATVQVRSGTSVNEGAAVAMGANYAGAVTGYAGTANVIAGTFTPTATWTYYTFTSAAPIGLTVSELALLFGMVPVGTAGTTDGFQIAGVQLEIGSAATPFEHRDIGVELELCQRFCFVLNEPATTTVDVATGMCLSASTAKLVIPMPVTMRAAPTVTVTIGSFSVLATTGTAVTLTSGGPPTGHSVNAISVLCSAASGLLAGYGTLLGGTGGGGLITASCDL